jgi:hypothetical protein
MVKQDPAVLSAAVNMLRSAGYHVAEPNEKWERKCDFIERVGIDHDKFHRKMFEWSQRGHVIPLTEDPSKRIRSVLSNPEFDTFCREK